MRRNFDWIGNAFDEYTDGVIENGYKAAIAMSLIKHCVQQGHKILLYRYVNDFELNEIIGRIRMFFLNLLEQFLFE